MDTQIKDFHLFAVSLTVDVKIVVSAVPHAECAAAALIPFKTDVSSHLCGSRDGHFSSVHSLSTAEPGAVSSL